MHLAKTTSDTTSDATLEYVQRYQAMWLPNTHHLYSLHQIVSHPTWMLIHFPPLLMVEDAYRSYCSKYDTLVILEVSTFRRNYYLPLFQIFLDTPLVDIAYLMSTLDPNTRQRGTWLLIYPLDLHAYLGPKTCGPTWAIFIWMTFLDRSRLSTFDLKTIIIL